MKEYEGKRCFIHLKRNEKDYFYTAEVLQITDKHICFKDKYKDIYTYLLDDIVKMNVLKEELENGNKI